MENIIITTTNPELSKEQCIELRKFFNSSINDKVLFLTNSDKIEFKRIKKTPILKLGETIPSVWLHMEFDFEDTVKYSGGYKIETEEELLRLELKYNN